VNCVSLASIGIELAFPIRDFGWRQFSCTFTGIRHHRLPASMLSSLQPKVLRTNNIKTVR
jgi:hypothetical protein